MRICRMWMIKKTYAYFLKMISSLFGIDAAKKFDTSFRFHKKLDLKNPKKLSEKVTYIELHEPRDKITECTDKYAVRKYVEEKGYQKILVPLVGGPWSAVSEINFDLLPNSFALKATHGCKMNLIVQNKKELNLISCRKELKKWLKVTYGTYSVEPHYFKIPHRLYAEKYLENADSLIDYKIHCLNGNPQFILVCSNRKANGNASMQVTLDLFDLQWNQIPEIIGTKGEVAGKGMIPKPGQLDEMINIAKVLSKDFKFVRVDLYELEGKIYFGELTFSPACCVFPYFTEKFDKAMGEKLSI